jgi:hypothetical protein
MVCKMPAQFEPDALMAYWLDEQWHAWEEIDEVGTAAAGLYARCGSYIADRKTDGFITSARARMYGTPEWIARLVEVGLWAVEENGFRDTRYLELNKTKAEIEKVKAAAVVRQRRARAKATRESRVTDASRHAGVTMPPFPPPSEGRAGTGRCPVHPGWPVDKCGGCRADELSPP